MSTHVEYILREIYYNSYVNKYLYKTQMTIYAHYGYPMEGLRYRNFAAFNKDIDGKIFMYDYEPLRDNKHFLELMRNYYEQKVVKHSYVENIESEVKKYIANHVNKIELTFDKLNGTTLLHDVIINNIAILKTIYSEAQNEYMIKELTK